MRILAVNQFYAPDHAATSQLLTDLCEDLVALGDEVTVIAGQTGYVAGKARLPGEETIRGVRVRRPWATGLGKGSIARRMTDYLSFFAAAVAAAAMEARPEVILALTTPPLIASGAALVGAARGVPLVTWVQDVFPDIAVAFGVLGARHPAAAALAALARATHARTSRIVVLSDGMAERLARQGAPPERLRVVQNWADSRAVRPVAHADNPFRREHGLEGRFVAMYSGNLGVVHDPAALVGAARRLAGRRPEVTMVFIGDGNRRAETEALARGLAGVRFLPYQPRERLAESLSAADVHLISLREGLDGLVVPSKLYGALASGRPVMFLGPERCEVARTIRAHDLGWAGLPGDEAGLAGALALAAASPAWCAERGARARAALLERYDRPIAVRSFRAILAEAAAGAAPRRASG